MNDIESKTNEQIRMSKADTRLWLCCRSLIVLCANMLLAAALPTVVYATTFTVNSTADAGDATPGDGLCSTATGECTLRAAIDESNALPGFPPEVITLPAGTYNITLGQLLIKNSLDLNGAGSDSTFIDGNDSSRVFAINGATKPIVHFFGVTIQNGNGGSFVPGGGIFIDAGAYLALSNSVVSHNKSTEFGGGISNLGELQIFTSTIQDNCVSNGAIHGVPCNLTPLGSGGGQTESGGGIFNFSMGSITIDESSISGNRATRGGGIRNGGGHLEITNSTISGNTANTRGGGIMNFGTAFIAYSTIAFNEANAIFGGASEDSFGGGIYNVTDTGAVVSIGNTILAMNTDNRNRFDSKYAPDCYSVSPATFTSFRGNLLGINANCNLRDTIYGDTRFDQVGTPLAPLDPRLGPLADNGGPTHTHALLPDSPAIDKGTGVTSATFFDCPATDQRGFIRPIDGDGDGVAECDVGAFEFGAVNLPSNFTALIGSSFVIDGGFFQAFWGFPADAQVFPNNQPNDFQQFNFSVVGSNFTICNVHNGACLTDSGNVVDIGQGTDNWSVSPNGSGWTLQNVRTGKFMGAIPSVARGDVPMSSAPVSEPLTVISGTPP